MVSSDPLSRADPLGLTDCIPGQPLPTSPKVFLNPKNKEAVEGMPWSDAPLGGRDPKTGLTTYGFNHQNINIICECGECCDGYHIVDLGADITFLILIDVAQILSDRGTIEIDPNVPIQNDLSVEGTYGHEQLHVLAMLDELPSILAGMNMNETLQKFGRGDAGRIACERRCDKFKTTWKRLVRDALTSGGHIDPTAVPLPGRSYPPYKGTFPRKGTNKNLDEAKLD